MARGSAPLPDVRVSRRWPSFEGRRQGSLVDLLVGGVAGSSCARRKKCREWFPAVVNRLVAPSISRQAYVHLKPALPSSNHGPQRYPDALQAHAAPRMLVSTSSRGVALEVACGSARQFDLTVSHRWHRRFHKAWPRPTMPPGAWSAPRSALAVGLTSESCPVPLRRMRIIPALFPAMAGVA